MRKYIYIFIITALLADAAKAQQRPDSTMQQTLTLEREFSPIVQQTTKIDQQPAPQPLQQNHSQATYAEWEAEAVRASDFDIIQAGQVVACKSQQPRLGYLQLSGGNYWNTDLKTGISKGNMNIDADGFLSRADLNIMQGNINATYNKEFANGIMLKPHIYAGGLISDLDVPNSRKHCGGTIGADICMETDPLTVKIAYNYQGVSSLNEHFVGASLRYGVYDKSPLWQAYIDIPVGMRFSDTKNFFTIKPALHLTFLPSDGQWKRYDITIASGTRHPGAYDLLQQIPIVMLNHQTHYKNLFDYSDITLSFNNNEQGYLRWGISAQIRATEDAIYLLSEPDNAFSDFEADRGNIVNLDSGFDLFYSVSTHCDYEYSQYFGIRAKASYQQHSHVEASFGQPLINGSIHFISSPGKITADLGMDAEICRKFPYSEPSFVEPLHHDLGDVYDLNFRLEWQPKDNLSFFASCNNILNKSAELFPGIEAQGINAHLGLHYKF